MWIAVSKYHYIACSEGSSQAALGSGLPLAFHAYHQAGFLVTGLTITITTLLDNSANDLIFS